MPADIRTFSNNNILEQIVGASDLTEYISLNARLPYLIRCSCLLTQALQFRFSDFPEKLLTNCSCY